MKLVTTIAVAILSLATLLGMAQSGAATKTQIRQLTEDNLLYLNGGSFDFGGTTNSGYVGHFNVILKAANKGWGVNGGFLKLNYQNDGENPIHSQIDSVIINPLHPPKPGDKYLVQLNKYTTRVKNSSFSIYAQPLWSVNKCVAFHLHGELYLNKYTVTTSVEKIAEDTLIASAGSPRVLRAMLPGDSVYRSVYANGYFGFGATFTLQVGTAGYLFLQPTVGITTDNISRHVAYRSRFADAESAFSTFYLFRAYYQHRLGNETTALIGTDIRGLFPKYEPQYGIYVGINVGLDGIAALF